MRYVLFKENPNTHQEQYLEKIDKGNGLVIVDSPEHAKGFSTAADAYRFGGQNPLLDWWRVGLR